MSAPNLLRESITKGKFCYVVELVASQRFTEEQVLDTAAELARIPGLAAGSVTSYAGGGLGHDPVRIAIGAKSRGLTPNVHVTCVTKDRIELRNSLKILNSEGIENLFALTGDYPQDKTSPTSFDMDSVQLVAMMNEMRKEGAPFWISVAVSPFKYTEADCGYQYLKLEKKIAAGADCAITQLGYDVRKFRELKQYLNDRVGRFPVLGNVYVLTAKTAQKMAKGEPPGCWVSPELVEKTSMEAQAPDKGKAARLERAARSAAILRGLDYAGAYLGGTNDPQQVKWIIQRAEELYPRWEELADELTYGKKGGFYFYDAKPQEVKSRGLIPSLISSASKLFPVDRDNALRRTLARFFGWIAKHPKMAQDLERLEFAVKSPMFGCHACGNCVLSSMEYVCPQTCPKQLRNGPCGGTFNGHCEVVDQQCIWVSVYERAKAASEIDSLKVFVPPPDRSLKGTSSWINYFLNRDVRPRYSDLVAVKDIKKAYTARLQDQGNKEEVAVGRAARD